MSTTARRPRRRRRVRRRRGRAGPGARRSTAAARAPPCAPATRGAQVRGGVAGGQDVRDDGSHHAQTPAAMSVRWWRRRCGSVDAGVGGARGGHVGAARSPPAPGPRRSPPHRPRPAVPAWMTATPSSLGARRARGSGRPCAACPGSPRRRRRPRPLPRPPGQRRRPRAASPSAAAASTRPSGESSSSSSGCVSGSPKRALNSTTRTAPPVSARPAYSRPDEGGAPPGQLVDGGLQHALGHLVDEAVGRPGQRRVGAHAARVGPLVAVAHALEVLGGQHGQHGGAVGDREQRDLRAVEVLLDDHPSAGGRVGERHLAVVGHDDALAGREAVVLDDVRRHRTRRARRPPPRGVCRRAPWRSGRRRRP